MLWVLDWANGEACETGVGTIAGHVDPKVFVLIDVEVVGGGVAIGRGGPVATPVVVLQRTYPSAVVARGGEWQEDELVCIVLISDSVTLLTVVHDYLRPDALIDEFAALLGGGHIPFAPPSHCCSVVDSASYALLKGQGHEAKVVLFGEDLVRGRFNNFPIEPLAHVGG